MLTCLLSFYESESLWFTHDYYIVEYELRGERKVRFVPLFFIFFAIGMSETKNFSSNPNIITTLNHSCSLKEQFK